MTNDKTMDVEVTQEIENLAQFLHDEGGFGDAWINHTWPEHPDDTGQLDGGWLKIVPSDVQAQFRDVARRMHASFIARHRSQASAGLREALERIAKMTPIAAGAQNPTQLHLTVKAIAESAIAGADR